VDDGGWRYDFFIAHASGDSSAATELYRLLILGARVFLDSETLLPGDDWDRELAAAQRQSLVTVVLLSSRSGSAYYQREEIAAAISMARENNRSHRVVPVYLEEGSIAEVPYGLRVKHPLTYLRHGGLEGIAAQLRNLLAKLQSDPAADKSRSRDQPQPSRNPPAEPGTLPTVVGKSSSGEPVIRCGKCQGTGTKDRDGQPPKCSVCDGAGHVVLKGPLETLTKCPFCLGDGTRDRDGRDPVCPACGGVGGFSVDPPIIQCSACGGTGSRDRDGRLPLCDACSGKGVRQVGLLKRY